MGATNVIAAYTLYAGRIPPTSMQLLAYMAVVSKDDDPRPWYGQGHHALAVHALGRPAPPTRADVKAVERAITPLLAAGAIVADRRGSVRRHGPSTVRYRLNLVHVPRKPGDDTLPGIDEAIVENLRRPPSRPPKNGHHIPSKSGDDTRSRPPKTVPTSPGNRGTEEPRGDNNPRSKVEDQGVDPRTELTVTRTRERPSQPQDPSPAAKPDPWWCQSCSHHWPVADGQSNLCPKCGGRGSFHPPAAPQTCPSCDTLLDPDRRCRTRHCPAYHPIAA